MLTNQASKEQHRWQTEPSASEDNFVTELYLALDQIPPEERLAYTKATRLCPQLLGTESPPVAFLRCLEYNVWSAAHRLVRYWQTRQDMVFGGDSAFLPLRVISGHGALQTGALETLQAARHSV